MAGSSPRSQPKEVNDGAEVGSLLNQVVEFVASFTADGGHDQDRVYASAAKRSPEAAVVVHALNRVMELGRPTYVRTA